MAAAEFGETAKIQLLLARGAKLNVEDNKGRTALDYAKDPTTCMGQSGFRSSGC